MATDVSNAVGTHKQFRKQPQDVYQKKLKDPSFGSSIGQHRDLGAEQLAASLGVLGKAIWKEKVEHEKREMNQFTLEEALNMVAGKTPEDLAKFNKMDALKNANTGFNLSDNKYAMALLERAMGCQASFLAKQQYLKDTEGIVPTSVEDAVSAYTDRFQESLKQYEGKIKNKEAFNHGVYENFYKDTLIIADKAREMIDRDNREAGLRCSATAFQDFITYSGNLAPDAFKKAFEEITRDTRQYCKTRSEAVDFWKKVLKENVDVITSFAQLDVIKETTFFVVPEKDEEGNVHLKEFKLGDELPMGDLYDKVSNRFISDTAKQIANSNLREDGNVDLAKAREALSQVLKNNPNEKALAYTPDYEDKIWTRVQAQATDIARINNDKWQANENQLIVDLSKATSHEESRAFIENSDLPKYVKVKYFDALDKSIKAEAKALERAAKNEMTTTERWCWDYYKNHYEKDNQTWVQLMEKYSEKGELSEAEWDKITRIAMDRDKAWSFFNEGYESQYGYQNGVYVGKQNLSTSYSFADYRKQEDADYTMRNLKASIEELKANGSSDTEIKRMVVEYCVNNNLDFGIITQQLSLRE